MKAPTAPRSRAWVWGVMALPVVSWLLELWGVGLPRSVERSTVVLAVATALFLVGASVVAAVRSGERTRRGSALALLALVLLSLALRYLGLGFELTDHFHNDEGTFLAGAKAIADGQLLPVRFHYPHLLYYLSAFVLWIQDLFPSVTGWLGASLFGASAEQIAPLALRILTATLSAMTTVPVFLAARRVAGLWAGTLAGALIALSPTYNEVSHQAISDVPSGFFVALTLYFAVRLLHRETTGDYLWAGVAAGLSAASKYPAGVVAVAILGVWLWWRVRQRDVTPDIVWSGVAALATLLAVMPALWLRFEGVFGGEHDILFGYRQYAQRGWIGVVVESPAAYYREGLIAAFGLPAIVLGVGGLFRLKGVLRSRLLALLPYPVAMLVLLTAMNMVVKRNLQPVLPAVALILGIGLSVWVSSLDRWPPWGRIAATALAVIVLLMPAADTFAWDISRTRPGTRQLAVEWIEGNVPHGARFVKESYTPDLNPKHHPWDQVRYAARLEVDELRDPRYDFLLLAANAHFRFLSREKWTQPHHEVFHGRYRELFELDLVQRFEPGRFRSGPDLLLYRLDPEAIDYVSRRTFSSDDVAWFSHPALEPKSAGEPVRFGRRRQSVLFKQHFEPGRYRVQVNSQAEGVAADLYVLTRDNRPIGEFPLVGGAVVELPSRDKYFFRVFLSAGGALREVVVSPLGAAS